MSGFETAEPWVPEPLDEERPAFVRSIRCSFCGHLEPGGSLLGHYRECPDYPAIGLVPVLGASSTRFRQSDEAALQVAAQHETQVRFKW